MHLANTLYALLVKLKMSFHRAQRIDHTSAIRDHSASVDSIDNHQPRILQCSQTQGHIASLEKEQKKNYTP